MPDAAAKTLEESGLISQGTITSEQVADEQDEWVKLSYRSSGSSATRHTYIPKHKPIEPSEAWATTATLSEAVSIELVSEQAPPAAVESLPFESTVVPTVMASQTPEQLRIAELETELAATKAKLRESRATHKKNDKAQTAAIKKAIADQHTQTLTFHQELAKNEAKIAKLTEKLNTQVEQNTLQQHTIDGLTLEKLSALSELDTAQAKNTALDFKLVNLSGTNAGLLTKVALLEQYNQDKSDKIEQMQGKLYVVHALLNSEQSEKASLKVDLRVLQGRVDDTIAALKTSNQENEALKVSQTHLREQYEKALSEIMALRTQVQELDASNAALKSRFGMSRPHNVMPSNSTQAKFVSLSAEAKRIGKPAVVPQNLGEFEAGNPNHLRRETNQALQTFSFRK